MENEQCVLLDEERRIAPRRRVVRTDFAVKLQTVAPLPVEGFDPGVVLAPRLDRFSLITVRNAKYPVPSKVIGREVSVSLHASQPVVFDGRAAIAEHPRMVARGAASVNLHYGLEVL